ncbi:MAG: hypothetical protein ACRC0V_06685, partial [Fusobacteriaceae bacterium]
NYILFNLFFRIGQAYKTLGNFDKTKEFFLVALNLECGNLILDKNKFDLIIMVMKIVSNLGEVNSKKEKEFVEELDNIYKKLFEKEKNFEPLIYFIDYFSKWKKFSVQNYLKFFKNT